MFDQTKGGFPVMQTSKTEVVSEGDKNNASRIDDNKKTAKPFHLCCNSHESKV